MNIQSEKYSSYSLEISVKSRPFILVVRVDDEIKIISINDEFKKLHTWNIYENKLQNNNDFIVFCEGLLARKGDTNDNGIVFLGSSKQQVDLYAVSRRTSQSTDLSLKTSDLLVIQVDCIQYQDAVRPTNKTIPPYQLYVDEQIFSLKSTEIKELLVAVDECNKLLADYQKINERLLILETTINNSVVNRLFKNLSLKGLVAILVGLSSIISPFLLANKESIKDVKTLNKEILEFVTDVL